LMLYIKVEVKTKQNIGHENRNDFSLVFCL
jgi:hypothetical protein